MEKINFNLWSGILALVGMFCIAVTLSPVYIPFITNGYVFLSGCFLYIVGVTFAFLALSYQQKGKMKFVALFSLLPAIVFSIGIVYFLGQI